jgi:outer membrane lipoprotein LolB
MRVRAFYVAALVTVLAAISGCASPLAPSAKMERAPPFDVLGRVLVSYDGRAFSANVRWNHAPDADEIWLMTPTGQALAHMLEDAGGATLTAADRSQYRAARVELLTKQALGWEMPVAHLQYWIRGVPSPDDSGDILERDAAGKIKRLAQDGWRIAYEYYPASENDGLPRRMEVVGPAQSMRLVIDTWRREPATP